MTDPIVSEHAPKASDRQVGGDHYKLGSYEPWEVMRAWYPDSFHHYLMLSAIKYLARADKKGNYRGDVAKAHHYLEKLLEEIDRGN